MNDESAATPSTQCLDDNSECHIIFNVMPNRPVREELRIREFRIGEKWIEAEFDRSYHSTMLNSPSHLTFVSALIQMQKLTYVYSCYRFGLNPSVHKRELLKVWPTSVSVDMREMVTEEKQLVHRMDFTGFRKIEDKKYLATTKSRCSALQIDASAMIMLLADE